MSINLERGYMVQFLLVLGLTQGALPSRQLVNKLDAQDRNEYVIKLNIHESVAIGI